MKNINYKTPHLILVFAGILVFAASISAQTINGCADKNTGYLRRIVPPSVCKSSEMPVGWNIQGPTGLQGLQGSTGPIGPQERRRSRRPTRADRRYRRSGYSGRAWHARNLSASDHRRNGPWRDRDNELY